MSGDSNIFGILTTFASGPLLPNDKFFEDGNKCVLFLKKFGIVEVDNEDFLHEPMPVFQCNVLGCTKSFDTVFLFDQHYNSRHKYSCIECKKNLQTAHLLDLHVSEAHDSYFAACAYQCLLEECKEKFENPELRKDHCLLTHKFPSTFSFEVSKPDQKNKTKDKTKTKMSKKKKELDKGENMDIDKPASESKPKILGSGYRGSGQRLYVNFTKDLANSLPSADAME